MYICVECLQIIIKSEILEYFEEVLKEINLLHLKVNDMLDSINIIIKSTKVNTEAVVNDDKSEVLKIIHLFPMTEESLIKVEDWIAASIDNKIALVRRNFLFQFV